MKSRLLKFGLILVAIALCLGVSYVIYGIQKAKQVKQIMKIVYKHDPKFGKGSKEYPYPRITRLAPNGKEWLVLNTWDVSDANGRNMLDGQDFMIIRNDKVIEYQKGRASNLSAMKFLCRPLFNEKTSRWIFDESGKRKSCIDNSDWEIWKSDK